MLGDNRDRPPFPTQPWAVSSTLVQLDGGDTVADFQGKTKAGVKFDIFEAKLPYLGRARHTESQGRGTEILKGSLEDFFCSDIALFCISLLISAGWALATGFTSCDFRCYYYCAYSSWA